MNNETLRGGGGGYWFVKLIKIVTVVSDSFLNNRIFS